MMVDRFTVMTLCRSRRAGQIGYMTDKTLHVVPEGDNQLELFAPAFADVAFRDQQDLMENPLCTLGKTPRKEPIRYQVGDKFVTVSANSETGIATIYDHDILIW